MPREKASGLWRSEDMVRLDIITQREVLHDTVMAVGLLGKAQFVDMNAHMNAFSRPYVAEVRRCDDLDRKLRFITAEMESAFGPTATAPFSADGMDAPLGRPPLAALEERMDALVAEVTSINASLAGLRRELNYQSELSHLRARLHESADATHTALSHALGVVDSARAESLFAVAYRLTRGNAIIDISASPILLMDPASGARTVSKTPFAVFVPSAAALTRLEKMLAGFGVDVRRVADVLREEPSGGVSLEQLYLRMTDERRHLLATHANAHAEVMRLVRAERLVYAAMNLCRVAGTTCTASIWMAERHEDALRHALLEAVRSSAGDVQSVVARHASQANPPTQFETNRFTACFQGIVDSYGMARYKEVNPGVFTIVTFPYLFGIMYGDIGHGLLLLLFSIYFIFVEPRWRGQPVNEILAMLLNGRYLLLLMSLFSIYMGALYNDFFGFSVGLFTSAYEWPNIHTQNGTVYPIQPNNTLRPSHVYPMGLDVTWAETENKLEFYNSVKMKCAVIVGVVQMLAGNILSFFNHLYNRDPIKIFALFIPEAVFLLCTFGYMSVLIVLKWCTRWDNTSEAPSILETMTNFFLQPGTVTKPLYNGQSIVQVVLLLIAFAMVPVMLIVMPIVESQRHKRHLAQSRVTNAETVSMESLYTGDNMTREVSSQPLYEAVPRDVYNGFSGKETIVTGDDIFSDAEGTDEAYSSHPPHFDMSEVVIHYMIHTIEYVLGCVSNTASYLRLWALSLAHAQLSEVFFNFAIVKVLGVDSSGVFIAVGAAVWLAVTLAVLVGMEALSAFLHALRLHWVEFNNKFYTGDGFALEPLDLLGDFY